MGLRETLSTAADRATEGASEAGDAVAETAAAAGATASDRATSASAAAADRAGTAGDVLSTAADRARDRVAGTTAGERLPDPHLGELPGAVPAVPTDRVPTDRVAAAGSRLRPLARDCARSAVTVAGRMDARRTYRYARLGFAYGGKCGQYVPFGSALPYAGLLAGAGVGLLDAVDALPADLVEELPASAGALLAADAAEEGPLESGDLVPGGADVPTVDPSGVDERTAADLAGMDYDEFAGR
jgi:hypothetical protein